MPLRLESHRPILDLRPILVAPRLSVNSTSCFTWELSSCRIWNGSSPNQPCSASIACPRFIVETTSRFRLRYCAGLHRFQARLGVESRRRPKNQGLVVRYRAPPGQWLTSGPRKRRLSPALFDVRPVRACFHQTDARLRAPALQPPCRPISKHIHQKPDTCAQGKADCYDQER